MKKEYDHEKVIYRYRCLSHRHIGMLHPDASGELCRANGCATSSGADDFYQLGNGKVIFSVVNAPNDKQLWITDGTSTGTVLLKDVFTGSDDFPYTAMEFFALGNGTGVFTASDAASGTELWEPTSD